MQAAHSDSDIAYNPILSYVLPFLVLPGVGYICVTESDYDIASNPTLSYLMYI